MSNKSLTYLRFLNTLDTLERVNPAAKLDFLEIQLLEHVLRTTSQDQTVLIGDLLKLNHLGSQATLHGRIKNLIANGYFKVTLDKQDARKKSVSPTKLAEKYLIFMSECVLKAAQ